MRATRYETRMVEQSVTVQQLACDNCGSVVDIEPLSRPEGWTSMQRQIDGRTAAWDFCEWECVLGFVTATAEDGPGTLLAQLEESLDAERAKRGEKV